MRLDYKNGLSFEIYIMDLIEAYKSDLTSASDLNDFSEDFHSKHGHNFIGDRNYYVMPREVYEKVKHLIPWNVGVYIFNDKTMECIKKARVVIRTRPCSEILLMMFRSANRENIKHSKVISDERNSERTVEII